MNKAGFKDKNELRRILSGAVKIDSHVIEVSRISAYCFSVPPSVRTTLFYYLLLFSGAWFALVGGIWSLQVDKFSDPTYWYGPISFFTGFLGVASGIIYRRRSIRLLKEALNSPYAELNALYQYLEKYIKNVRHRTQTHFNAVGSDALTNIILLDNMKKAIHDRVIRLNQLMSVDSYKYLLKADEVLRRSMRFCECPELQSNIFYDIQMEDLRDSVEALLANMDLGLNGVENMSHIDFKGAVHPYSC